MPSTQRPLRELCHALTITAMVKAGLREWGCTGVGLAELLGPRDLGIRVRSLSSANWISVSAQMHRDSQGWGRGTIAIGPPFQVNIWVDEHAVAIRPGRHWTFTCRSCGRACRTFLWPPRGRAWECRRCLNPRYADRRRLNTLLPRPDAFDDLERIERDLRRLRLIMRKRRPYETRKRAPEWNVTL
jgi:hypothetical protein